MYDYLEKFLEYINLQKNFSKHTHEAYSKDINKYLEFLKKTLGCKVLGIENFTADSIRDYIYILSNSGLSRKSIARKLASIKSFGKFLVSEGVYDKSPAGEIKTPKIEKKEPVFLSLKEIEMLMDITVSEDMITKRDCAIMEVFYSTGIRLSELCGLDLESMDFHNDVVKVTGKGRKQRIVPIGSKAVDSLKNYLPLRNKTLLEKGNTGEKALFINNRAGRLGKEECRFLYRNI